MNRKEKNNLLRQQLQWNLNKMNQSLSQLDFSHKKTSRITSFDKLSPEELESYEAFCARFARTADLLIQKIFTTVFLLLEEPQQTIIDRVNLAEKLGLIDQAEALLEIRNIRHEISHEYADLNLLQIFKDVARFTPTLKKAVKQTASYAQTLLNDGSEQPFSGPKKTVKERTRPFKALPGTKRTLKPKTAKVNEPLEGLGAQLFPVSNNAGYENLRGGSRTTLGFGGGIFFRLWRHHPLFHSKIQNNGKRVSRWFHVESYLG